MRSASKTLMSRTSRQESATSPLVVDLAVTAASRVFPASRNYFDQLRYGLSEMPFPKHSSVMLYSLRSPFRTIRIFS